MSPVTTAVKQTSAIWTISNLHVCSEFRLWWWWRGQTMVIDDLRLWWWWRWGDDDETL